MTGHEVVVHLQPASDFGKRGRPGIPGTQKALDAEVQRIMRSDAETKAAAVVAVALIRERVIAAYRLTAA